jgi:hypothetical protein
LNDSWRILAALGIAGTGTSDAHQIPSISSSKGKRWRARYVDDRGRERKAYAKHWLDKQAATIVSGTQVAARDAQRSGATCRSRVTRSTANRRCGRRGSISRRSLPVSDVDFN